MKGHYSLDRRALKKKKTERERPLDKGVALSRYRIYLKYTYAVDTSFCFCVKKNEMQSEIEIASGNRVQVSTLAN